MDAPDFSDRPQVNPYAASGEPLPPSLQPPAPGDEYPGFCRIYFIVDLVFCGIRALLVTFAVINLQNPEVANQPMVATTSMYEVATGLGMVLFGVPANILMLLKQRLGVYVAVLKILATFGSYAVGIWQLSFFLDAVPPGAPERFGIVAGAGIALMVRIALLGVYAGAIVTFVNWLNRRDRKMVGV